jgi:transcriptional regulator with XRE-family HTH domain
MRLFENIAQLIKTRRTNHPKGYSQSDLSHILGYKNGQFISNVERALCNIPLKMLRRVSEVLDIPRDELKAALLKDQENTLEYYLSGEGESQVVKLVGEEDRNKNPQDQTSDKWRFDRTQPRTPGSDSSNIKKEERNPNDDKSRRELADKNQH